MSGGKIKFLEEAAPNLAEKMDKVFPLKEECIFAGRLLVAGFLATAVFFLLKWCEQVGTAAVWKPMLCTAVFYWLLEICVNLMGIRASARIIMGIVPLFKLVSWILCVLTVPYGVLSRRLGAIRLEKNEDGDTAPTVEDEILSLVEGEAAAENAAAMQALEEDEKRMIRGALELDDISVRKIMTPRVDVVCVEYQEGMALDEFVAEVRATIVQSGHSRIPVYSDTIDNIIGVVYSKDLLDPNKLNDFDSFVHKKLLVIPESKNIGDLMDEFRQNKIHLAVVVDEYGGTAGIVTFEDVLETLVGDIQDEYDYAEGDDALCEVSSGVWHCDARTPVEVVNRIMDVEIPEDEEYDTIGGYLSYVIGRIPVQNEEVDTPVLTAKICKADSRRAIELDLSKKADTVE